MKSRKNALTLVEVLVAILVFSIGVIAVITLFPLSLQNVQTSQDLLIATELAASTVEYFNQPVNDIQAAILTSAILRGFMPIKDTNAGGRAIVPNTQMYVYLGDETLIERYIGYERAIDVRQLPADADFTERHLLRVTIRWNDSRGRAREFTTSSIIFTNKRVYN